MSLETLLYTIVAGVVVLMIGWIAKKLFTQPHTQNPKAKVHMTIIGGGGSGGVSNDGAAGGGGGAGGVIKDISVPIQAFQSGKSYKIEVGKGGTNGSDGGRSSFDGIIIAHGGQGGQGGNYNNDKPKPTNE